MPAFVDITGKKFGKLAVVERSDNHISSGGNSFVAWVCLCDCGNVKTIIGSRLKCGRAMSCGCETYSWMGKRIGDKNPNWNGGKKLSEGYVYVNLGRGKYRSEHRLIMEQYLGRALLSTETVHHKNGIRSDNRIKNLELWKSKHPKGQRVNDLNFPYNQTDPRLWEAVYA